MTDVGTRRRSMPPRNPDLRQIQVLSNDVCGASRQTPYRAYTQPATRHTSAIVAINLFVESDGSQPVQPANLRGGEQARRHRVVCNRGHGLLRTTSSFSLCNALRAQYLPETTLSPLVGIGASPGVFLGYSGKTYSPPWPPDGKLLTGTHRRIGHPPKCKGPAARRSTRHSKPAIRARAKRRPLHLHPAGRQSTGHAQAAGPAAPVASTIVPRIC